MTNARQVQNEYNLQEADDTGQSVSAQICRDVKLYPPTNWGFRGTMSYRPNPRYMKYLTFERYQLSSAHVTKSVPEDSTSGPPFL